LQKTPAAILRTVSLIREALEHSYEAKTSPSS